MLPETHLKKRGGKIGEGAECKGGELMTKVLVVTEGHRKMARQAYSKVRSTIRIVRFIKSSTFWQAVDRANLKGDKIAAQRKINGSGR